MHAFLLIPLEFGLLHATPLGGMLVGMFHSLFGSLGFEFAKAAADAGTAAIAHGMPGHVCGLDEIFLNPPGP
jgi:hypothetical protein